MKLYCMAFIYSKTKLLDSTEKKGMDCLYCFQRWNDVSGIQGYVFALKHRFRLPGTGLQLLKNKDYLPKTCRIKKIYIIIF